MKAAMREIPGPVEQDILENVNSLATLILEKQADIESQRCLPSEIVEALKTAGIFRMTVPEELGGWELDPVAQLQAIEKLAWCDASVGWCAMIGCDGGLYSGFLEPAVGQAIFANPDTITASALTATGKATITQGGYIVEGRWPFVSGCRHSDIFVLGCTVYKDDEQQFLPNGTPQTLQCIVPAAKVSILDTWVSMGLRGSGSHDVTVSSCFVANNYSFSFQNLHFYRPKPLYSFPLSIILNFSSVPLGVAQRALDELLKCADKPSRVTLINGELSEKRTLKDEAFVQEAVGMASAKLQATRTYLYATIGEIWSTLQNGQELSPSVFGNFQSLNAYVYDACTDITESLFKIRGGSAVYQHSPFDRCLRDLLTMNQHVMNSRRSYAMAGRILLGLPPEQILL